VAAEGAPQPKDDSARLEESHLAVRLLGATPPECLIEGTGAGEIPHAEGHETDPLLHLPTILTGR
jgi:hypothetical protein